MIKGVVNYDFRIVFNYYMVLFKTVTFYCYADGVDCSAVFVSQRKIIRILTCPL